MRSSQSKLASADCLPGLSSRDALVRMLQHLRVARQKPATGRRANRTLDLHHANRVVCETAKKSGERAGREMAASLALPVKLRFPTILDVNHCQRVMERTEIDSP